MPSYTVRDPASGRSVTLTGDSPPTEQELEEVFASLPAQQNQAPVQQPSFMEPSTAISTVTGGPAGPAMGRQVEPEKFTNALRYGVPIAAGFAAAPFTGGMSVPASIATIAGIGGIASGVAETAAQGSEIGFGVRDGMNVPEVARAFLLGATPIKSTGGVASRIIANVPSMLLTQEAGKFVAGEEMFRKPQDPKEFLLSYGIPVLLAGTGSIAGGTGQKVSGRVDRANEIRAERFGGEPTLSDILGKASALEIRLLNQGNKIALDIYDNISGGVNQAVAKAFSDIPNTTPIAADIAKQTGRLSNLEQRVNTANEALVAAQRRAEDAVRNQRLNAPAAVREARQAALTKVSEELILNEGVQSFLGRVPSAELDMAGDISRMMKPISDTVNAVDNNARGLIGELYTQAGIQINSPVATRQMVFMELAKKRASGPLSGNDAYNRARAAVARELNDPSGIVTLEKMQEIKQKIAKDFEESGLDRGKANAIAANVYDAVSNASERFIEGQYGKDVFGRYMTAQQAARANFLAKDADIVRALADGDATGVYNTIKNKGFSESGRQIEAYENAIINAANKSNPEAIKRATEAAGAFRRSVMGVIKGNVLKEAATIPGGVSGINAINPAELAQNLDILRRKGVPIEELGLGDPSKLRALVRIASVERNGPFSPDDINSFVKEAEIVGADAAAYRAKFRREVRDELLASSSVQGRRVNVRRAGVDLNKARLSERELANELIAIRNDPLVKFMDQVGTGQTPNVTEYGDLVQSLFTSDEKVVRGLMSSLERSPGRAGYVDKIRKNAAAQVFGQFTDEGSKVNKAAVVTFFDGLNGDEIKARKSLEAILGSNQFNSLRNSFYRASKSALSSERALSRANMPQSNLGAVRFKMAGVGPSATYTGLDRIIGLIDNKRYSTAYMLYINPNTAPQFAKAGYNIDKFASSQAANAVLLRAAQQEDEEANR